MRGFFAIGALLTMAGCAAVPDKNDPMIWSRLDCQSMREKPELKPAFEQAKLVCGNRAQASGLAGSAPYMARPDLASTVGGVIAQSQISEATVKSCMAEYGYTITRRSELAGRCPGVTIPSPEEIAAQ